MRRPTTRTVPVPGITDEAAALDALLSHIRLLGPIDTWGAQASYKSVPLAIVDSIWSIGVRYQGVLNVIDRLRAFMRARGRDADAITTTDFLSMIESTGGAEGLAKHVSNRQRTSTRGGVLKAEAVHKAACVIAESNLQVPQDIRFASPQVLDTVERRWLDEVPGQSSGKSWDYFLMLMELPGVKGDRMICRFVATALGRPNGAVQPDSAKRLVLAAAKVLNVDSRDLDYNIWSYQRGQ